MPSRSQSVALALALLAVAVFVVSMVLGITGDAPAVVSRQNRDLPGVFSGKRVEVLNATRRAGLARQATQRLRDAGFDVVYFGTTTTGGTSSEVIDRVGKRDIAAAVARTLGITKVTTEIDSTRLVEASVVLGQDWPPPAAERKKN